MRKRCSQCGKAFTSRACGPTHAVVAEERRLLRRANEWANVADKYPYGLEVRWDGALTTTTDLALTMASLTLDGLDVGVSIGATRGMR